MPELLPGPVETTPMPHAVGPVMMAVPGPPGGGGDPETIGALVAAYLVANPPTTNTEATQDIVGAMVAASGGTYDDMAGTITLRDARPAMLGASGTDRLAALRDFGGGTCKVALVSDSTGNDVNDWFRIFANDYGATLPTTLRRVYRRWDSAAAAYVDKVDAAGVVIPASGGVIVHDTFSRTAADIVGSTSDNGKVWSGTAGSWTADGSVARVGATTAGLAYSTGLRDGTLTAKLKLVTTATGASQAWRFYLGGPNARLSSNGVWAGININASGAASLSLYKTISAVSTSLASGLPSGIITNIATVQDVTVSVALSIQQVTMTVTVGENQPVVMSGTITESDYAGLGTYVGVTGWANTTGFTMDEVTIETPVIPESAVDGLTMINTSVAGATLAYQQGLLATLFPAGDIDVLIVATGHNYGTDTPQTFLPKVSDFISAYTTAHPETLIVIMSQNPEREPAVNRAAHLARQQSLRAWATASGYEYVPVFESFAAQPSGGADLIAADGVHPTTPPTADLTVWSGARLWANVVLAAVSARSMP